MRHLLTALLLGVALPVSAAVKSTETPKTQAQKLQLELIQVRAKLLREDPSLAKRHREIMDLYRKLDRELANHPEIMVLQKKINQLNKK